MTDGRPTPRPNTLSQPFWDSTSRHQLIRPFCQRCARSFFPPQLCCSGCLGTDWTWLPSGGFGVVYSHTTVYRAPMDAFEVPYVLAVVDLEDGFSMMTNIVDTDPDDVRIGMCVAVRWRDLDGITLPVFAPDVEKRVLA